MKFKKGDWVRILPRRNEWFDQHPTYTGKMMKFAGHEAIVTRRLDTSTVLGLVGIDESGSEPSWKERISKYNWHEDWLEKVESLEKFSDEDFKI